MMQSPFIIALTMQSYFCDNSKLDIKNVDILYKCIASSKTYAEICPDLLMSSKSFTIICLRPFQNIVEQSEYFEYLLVCLWFFKIFINFYVKAFFREFLVHIKNFQLN